MAVTLANLNRCVNGGAIDHAGAPPRQRRPRLRVFPEAHQEHRLL